jgi:glycosyltransferase involved in cell wall biosynthesis
MPTLELSMIVKNGAAGLARCLASVQGIVDRITIGDTGSTDDTVAIAERFGAQVISVPWHNDFAQARNAVLAYATCDWILFLDADEMLDPAAAAQIPSLLLDPAIAGYDVSIWNYVMDIGFRSSGEQAVRNPGVLPGTSAYPAYFLTTKTNLFRRDPGVFFEHCVHETVADRLAALKLRRKPAEFVVHHFGYAEDENERRAEKESLYYDLALKKVAGSRNSYPANLGAGIAELDHAKNPAAALPFFKKALALDARRPQAWLYTGICLMRLGRNADALSHLSRARAMDANNPLFASSLGDLHLQLADHARARDAYAHAIALGDASPLTLAKLGAAEVHLGDRATGIAKVEQAVAQSPASAELYDIYATAAFLAGKPAAACEAADRRLAMKNVSAFNFLLAATLHLHTNMRQKAEGILHAGLLRFPEDTELRSMMTSLS